MKRFIFALILLAFHAYGFCQKQKMTFKKPSIDLSVLGKFSLATGVTISGDGNYVVYTIYDRAMATNDCYVNSLKFNWTLNIGSVPGEFSSDSKYLFYKNENDSLALMQLENRQVEYILNVSSFKTSNNGKWIGYCDKDKKLIIRNLETKKEKSVEAVTRYFFDPNDSCMFIESNQSNGRLMLLLVNLIDFRTQTIWNAQGDEKAAYYIFSKDGKRLAFTVESKPDIFLWLYEAGDNNHVKEIAKQALKGISPDLIFLGINSRGFTEDGNKLFIQLKEKDRPKPSDGVDVWSYTDAKLQPQQLKELGPKTYVGLLIISSKTMVTLEGKDRMLIAISDKDALVASMPGPGMYDDSYWNRANASSIYIISLEEGRSKLIDDGLAYASVSSYWFSKGGNYVLYYNAEQKNYFSYEIATGVKRNITSSIKTTWTTYVKRDVPMMPYWPIGFAGTIANDEAVLIYDQHDIYQIDPLGRKAPINLTNGYGRKNNIEFRIALESKKVIENNETVILSGFNRQNKNDGFYKIKIGESRNPELLTSQPYMFTGTSESDIFYLRTPPVKAKNAEVYLVRRMSAEESPNYFWTTDLKTFNRITDVQPQRNYNWMTTELVSWKTYDGDYSQGILYKPENFDSTKKYPLIFYYYENMSEGLHGFLRPELTNGTLNIPYYVSNGYLIFTPDMHYKIGHPGQSVVNTIVSAAKYLSKLPYIDSKHMGLQGHSRGGWETNFLVTNTNLFAAAMSSSGFCNYTNLYNGVKVGSRSGVSRQVAFEKMYQRIGATLWEKPELYIENSPVFKADKVTTPVLMMSNMDDDDVPFEQGVQFFTALRRMGKRAWMLQYDGQEHMVFDKSAEDLEIRMKQFFDHYLKDSACPRWMLYGIPAIEKGKPDALQLVYEKDENGKWLTPKEGGLLKEEEKKKIDALKKRKPETITID